MAAAPVDRWPRKRRVLIADDESIIRMDLGEMLTNLGYEVIGEVGDGAAAVELAKKLCPDLVIMDIKMPGVDGIAAARELTRERVAPVLLLTAYSEQNLVERAKEAGVVAYLVKPFREAELMPSIEVALSRFAEFQAVEKEVGSLKDALETRKVVEQAKGVLMETHGLKEAEAFHRIRKASMDTRKSMREIAEAILLAHQLEKSSSP
ncbi:MAG TPA: response regulator [Thermomicrobiales bacterium]|nr:response regulator [Thermomicrobiales bacterium]